MAFNIRKAGLFAGAAIGSGRGFLSPSQPSPPAAGSVPCAVETGGLPGGARRWKRVKAPKGNSCAAAILLPSRFLARCSRRVSSGPALPAPPSLRLSPAAPPGTPRPWGRGRGERSCPVPGGDAIPSSFPPEAPRSGVFLLLLLLLLPLPAGIGFFSFPRQERVNKTLLLLLLLASMAAKTLLTLRGRPERFPF